MLDYDFLDESRLSVNVLKRIQKSEIIRSKYLLKKKRESNDSVITRSLLLRRNIFNGTLPIKYKRFAGIRGENGSLQKKKKERRRENLSRVSPLQVDRAGVDRHGTKSEGPTSGLWQRGLQQIATSGEPCNKTAKKLTRPPSGTPNSLAAAIVAIDSGDESREDATARTTLRPGDDTNADYLDRNSDSGTRIRFERFQRDSDSPPNATCERTRFAAVCIRDNAQEKWNIKKMTYFESNGQSNTNLKFTEGLTQRHIRSFSSFKYSHSIILSTRSRYVHAKTRFIFSSM